MARKGTRKSPPDDVVDRPVSSLSGHLVYHAADHDGVNEIIQKNLKTGKESDPAPFPRVMPVKAGLSGEALFSAQQHAGHAQGQRGIDDKIAESDSIDAENGDQN